MAGGRLILLLLGVALPAAAARWEIDAEELVWDDGLLTTRGAVELRLEGETIHGHDLVVSEDRAIATLRDGSWSTPSGQVDFLEGEISLTTGDATLRGARLETPEGERLVAEVVILRPDAPLEATDVHWQPCACPGPEPWSVSARRVLLEPGKVLRARMGWLRLFGAPILPIPAVSVPLARRSGFLAPDLRWGEQGFTVATPLYLTLGEQADTTLTPEVRTRRSIRLLGELRYALRGGEGILSGGGGWDLVEERLRGSMSWRGEGSRGAFSHAVSAQLVSDLDVYRDYGDRYLDRSLPWTESRASVGIPALEVSSDTFQSTEITAQDLLRLDLSAPAADWGAGVVGHVQAWGIARRLAASAWGPGRWQGLGSVRARAARPTPVGPFVIGPRITSRASLLSDGQPLVADHESFLGLDVNLPMWRDLPGHFERLLLSVTGGLLVGETLQPSARAAATWRRTGRSLLEVRPQIALIGDRPEAALDTTWRQGPLAVRAEGFFSPEGSGGALWASWSTESATLSAGGVFAEDATVVQRDPEQPTHALVAQAAASMRLPGPLRSLRVLGGLRAEPLAPRWQSRWAGLAWRHPTGCIELGATGTLSPDRTLPDIALQLRLEP